VFISIPLILRKLLLNVSLIKSTIGIIIPNEDTLFGPTRCCEYLNTFRSSNVNHPDLTKINIKHNNMFIKKYMYIVYFNHDKIMFYM